jgi:hypothetical protein
VPCKDAEQQREYQREYGRMRRTGAVQTPGQTTIPLPFRLKTAAEMLALLEDQVGAMQAEGRLAAGVGRPAASLPCG